MGWWQLAQAGGEGQRWGGAGGRQQAGMKAMRSPSTNHKAQVGWGPVPHTGIHTYSKHGPCPSPKSLCLSAGGGRWGYKGHISNKEYNVSKGMVGRARIKGKGPRGQAGQGTRHGSGTATSSLNPTPTKPQPANNNKGQQ